MNMEAESNSYKKIKCILISLQNTFLDSTEAIFLLLKVVLPASYFEVVKILCLYKSGPRSELIKKL